MITIKSESEIKLMRHAGEVLVNMYEYLRGFIKEGVSLLELDKLAYDYVLKNDCVPTCLGFEGFPATLCLSVNDVVVHGIPNNYKLKNGDIVTIDTVVGYHGYQADAAYTYPVGEIDSDKKYLLEHTKQALFEGLAQVKPGNRIGDISNAVEQYANSHHLGVVRELCGHGIGSDMHEDPDVPNFGKAGVGPKLKPGMVICIEPMLTFGSRHIYLEDDDWTVRTCDKSPAAHFEYTILVTEDGYDVLTPWKD